MSTRSLERRFVAFHRANPQVYVQLRTLALTAKRAGVRKFGIAALFERLRWLSLVETAGDPYRLNNSYRAPYARLLMAQEPELRAFFTTRTDAVDRTFRARRRRTHHHGRPKAAAPLFAMEGA